MRATLFVALVGALLVVVAPTMPGALDIALAAIGAAVFLGGMLGAAYVYGFRRGFHVALSVAVPKLAQAAAEAALVFATNERAEDERRNLN